MEVRFELELECGETSLQVRRFDAHEELSTPFEVNLLARSLDHNVDLEAIVGKGARLVVRSDNPHVSVPEMSWLGVCSHAAQLKAEHMAASEGLSTYSLRIVPRLWLLTQNREHRIFQRLTVPQIVEKLFGAWDVEAKLELSEQHPKLDYVVQHGESDLAFVSRLLEQAGITYLFAHDDGPSKLVLRDQPQRVAPRPSVRFIDKPSEVSGIEHVSRVRVAERVAPGAVRLRDYDYRRPDYVLGAEAVAAPEERYEQYRYLPGASRILDPAGNGGTPVADDKGKVRHADAELTARAQRLLAAERCRKRLVSFETNCIDLQPGVIFSIDDHPMAELGEPLLVTSFTIVGSLDERWSRVGEAVPATEVYRPVERSPVPRAVGLMSAVVVGPPGEPIHTDEHARVRLQYHWDREGQHDDNASCWTRVSQGWAGRGFGKVLVPRVGQEVLVSAFEGDPSYPVVTGRVHNAVTGVPRENELPRYKTRSSWMSDTSPHADDSFNVIRYEDAKDKEYIFTQAERDQQKLVKRNETERTGQNRAELVGANRKAVVAEVDAVLVGKKYSLQMINPPTEDDLKIRRLGKPDVAPLSTKLEMVDGKILCTVGEATAVLDGKDITFEAKKAITFKASGNIVVHGGPNIHINPAGGGSAQAGCLERGSAAGSPFVEKAR